MIPAIGLNWLAILVATVAYFLIGAVWYSPSLFGPAWMKSMGISMDEARRPRASAMTRMYMLALINSFILVLVLSILIHVFNTANVWDAMQIGLLVWLGFVATDKMGSVLFEGKDAKYLIISSMYSFVGILAAAAILATWF
jgi:hypothetical protein